MSLPSFVPNFKILGQAVPEKSLTEKKVYTHTNKQTHGKSKNYIPPIYFVYRGYNKSLTENFIREKEKWTNKGTDKQCVADSLLHSTTCHYQALYQISRS